jgi:hypothetical protein
MTLFADAHDLPEILDTKARLFCDGDPERQEYSEFTDFGILQLPDRAPELGIVRLLRHLETGRHRLIMRHPSRPSALLNHFVVPGISLSVSGDRVSYIAEDHSAAPQVLSITLAFESPVVADYFRAKFEAARQANALLLDPTSAAPLAAPTFRLPPPPTVLILAPPPQPPPQPPPPPLPTPPQGPERTHWVDVGGGGSIQ